MLSPAQAAASDFVELDERAFARSVRGRIGRAEQREHRANVDDLAAPASLHDRVSGLRAKKGAGQVGVEHPMPLGCRVGLRRFADRGPGIVDENVGPAEPVGRLLDHRPTGVLVGDIERQ